MLEIGWAKTKNCQRVGRRSFLRVGSLGALASVSWADLLRQKAEGSPAKPRAIILLWLWGGPSHIDLFDLKRNATADFRGPFEPIATSVPGIQIGELLPGLAKRAHKYALIRSMNCASQDHGVAGTIGLTGSQSGALDLGGGASGGSLKPATGSIVARAQLGGSAALPSYVILGPPLKQGLKRVVGEGAGILGSRFDPFRLEYTLEEGIKIPHTTLPESLTIGAVEQRAALLKSIDSRFEARTTPMANMDRQYELAMSMLTSGVARELLMVEKEPEQVRGRYGMTKFGQSCLLARRLVESGIPFVQVNWSTHVEAPEDAGDGGWDMHDRNFQILENRHSWILDLAASALLDDLDDRGLLESTLVVAVGEFGRTPKINNKAGRDHWPQCYSALIAGAGVRGGTVIGASDRTASLPADRPVTPADLGATMLERLGITTTQLTSMNLTPQGSPVTELFSGA